MYPRPDRRRCYWDFRGQCLKTEKVCEGKCRAYLSVAQAESTLKQQKGLKLRR
ncbi:MAG: hypothetical protein PHQ43_13595 [Dehalococcoidales bacterium]|jgi:hypothetical protein|nr:hypothetical protein [Dehalococcoidales bacterium]